MNRFMNKFSSLSTSLMLACLTSSIASTSIAQSTEEEIARLNEQTSIKTDSNNIERRPKDALMIDTDQDFTSVVVNAHAENNQDIASTSESAVNTANSTVQESDNNKREVSPEVLKSSDAASLAAELLNTPIEEQGFFGGGSTNSQIEMEKSEQSIPLSNHAQFKEAIVSIEHPHELSESFIQAADTAVITYSNQSGSFIITVKLTPLSAQTLKSLNFTDFKQDITSRFSDKANLLYGEYNVITEKDEADHMEFAISGFLKKPADGFLPDMHNYFYERNIIDRGMRASVSCEFRGTQAQAIKTEMLYTYLGPLCERIINSFNYELK